MGKRGRFLGTAMQARKIGEALNKGEKEIEFPPGRNRALVFFTKEYAVAIRMLALYRMEKWLQQGTTKVEDVVTILDAAMRHEDWAIEKMKPKPRKDGKKKGGDKKEKHPAEKAEKPEEPNEKSKTETGTETEGAPEKVMEEPSAPPVSETDLQKLDDMKKPVTA